MALRAATSTTCRSPSCSRTSPTPTSTGAMLQFTSGRAAGHHVWISGRRGDYFTTGIGQEQFEHLAQGRGRRRRARRQLLVPRLPDLPPASGALDRRVPRVGPVPRRGQARSTRSDRSCSGPRFVRNNGAGQMSGRFAGKMIVVQSLFDEIAYPQQADWYRRRVDVGARRPHRRPVPRLVHRPRHAPGPRGDAARSTITPHRTHAHRQLPRGARAGAARPRGMGRTRRRAPAEHELRDSSTARSSSRHRRGAPRHPTGRAPHRERWTSAPRSRSANRWRSRRSSRYRPARARSSRREWDFEGAGDFPVVEPFDNEDVSYTSMTITA